MNIQIRPKVPVKIERVRDLAQIRDNCIRKRLSADDDAACRSIADTRSSAARASERKDERIATDLSGFQIDLMGAKGELAVCKYLGVDWEPCVDRPDGGIDLTLRNGRTIDVKAAMKIGHRLLFKRLDAFKADIAVLAYIHPDKRDVYLAGWCTREEFLAGHHRAFECKNSPGMYPKQLWPMHSLLAMAKVKIAA